ncbi:cysteine desulfurase family protein [Prochlorococcus sp. MIT 1300]|uniref:cysteine desulfurase family protein n=1 Tax=Prochlorococcus sp. MIT 1300 TaxID=3096218 RepID=UPI002A753F61|nr:cysteine desulfurase family protein [Prochlorococcus sp. MIT 1300]
MNSIYLDACSTTPIRSEVFNFIQKVETSCWGNPSSIHTQGALAAETLERSRFTIADNLNAQPEEVFFTSGATESIHLALLGITSNMKPARIVISSVEHPAVRAVANKLLSTGWDVVLWPVDHFGTVNLDIIDQILSPPTTVVSVIWGQSEVGTVQPIQKIAYECRARNIIFHTDATQYFSHYLVNWKVLPIDLLSASVHKMQGPKGVGLLLVRKGLFKCIEALQDGGKQEMGLRSGTEPVSLIAGMSKSIELLSTDLNHNNVNAMNESAKVKSNRDFLLTKLQLISELRFTGHEVNRLPNHISCLVSSVFGTPLSGRDLVRELSSLGVACSSGTACGASRNSESNVLKAMSIGKDWRSSGLRLSLGRWNTEKQLAKVPDLIKQAILNCE